MESDNDVTTVPERGGYVSIIDKAELLWRHYPIESDSDVTNIPERGGYLCIIDKAELLWRHYPVGSDSEVTTIPGRGGDFCIIDRAELFSEFQWMSDEWTLSLLHTGYKISARQISFSADCEWHLP